MKQTDLGLNLTIKRTRKREFLDEMNRAMPWADLVALVAPFAPEGRKGRPPFAVETMLRTHFMQQWFGLSDPAMEEALHDVPMYREFACLGWTTRIMKDGLNISGLTTAASIWVVSAIGVLLGAGLFAAAILMALLCMMSMSWVHRLEARLPGHTTLEVCLTFGPAGAPPFEELVQVAESRGLPGAAG